MVLCYNEKKQDHTVSFPRREAKHMRVIMDHLTKHFGQTVAVEDFNVTLED